LKKINEKKYNFNYVIIGSIAATVLYVLLFFYVPLHKYAAAYILLLYFGILLWGSIEMIFKKETIKLSKEESRTLIYLKDNKYDLMAVLATGSMMFDRIVETGIPVDNVSVLIFDGKDEDVMIDVEEFTEKLNEKHKKQLS
jgi:hypothetical protein